MEQERENDLQEILNSEAHLVLIVAGPGTGKSYTLRRIAESTRGSVVALTFLNNLADGLARDLGEFARTSTFHRFSRRLLHKTGVQGLTQNFDYYPDLRLIAATDTSLIDGPATAESIDYALMYLEEESAPLTGVLRSGDYYNAVGHNDAVYRLYRQFRDHPAAIPKFTRILVDEYQDFSLLEVSLIDSLATKSRVVVVGDDDQAIFKFRHASAEHIRERAAGGSFELHQLRYCTRCTSVLVDSLTTVVNEAQAIDLLAGRIGGREYICYLPEKEEDSLAYPKITHAEISVQRTDWNYMAKYVLAKIRSIPEEHFQAARDRNEPCVLIIGPKPFRTQVYDYLDQQLSGVELRTSSSSAMDVLDGYRRLMDNDLSRLGWRILLELQQPDGWKESVTRAVGSGEELSDCLDAGYRDQVLAEVALLKKVIADEPVSTYAEHLLTERTGRSLDQLRADIDRGSEDDPIAGEYVAPPVVVTTLVGAKGLQAQHTFVLGLNQGHFPKSSPTEQEVCQLLVALTRARRSCTLLSVRRLGGIELESSLFIDWLQSHIDYTYVDREAIQQLTSST